MKKAYLVTFEKCTRVIAESDGEAVDKAIAKFGEKIEMARFSDEEFFTGEDLSDVEEDTEIPYDITEDGK